MQNCFALPTAAVDYAAGYRRSMCWHRDEFHPLRRCAAGDHDLVLRDLFLLSIIEGVA
jgi:hypothetical protein